MMFSEVKLEQDRCHWYNYSLNWKNPAEIKSSEQNKEQRRYRLIYLEISK